MSSLKSRLGLLIVVFCALLSSAYGQLGAAISGQAITPYGTPAYGAKVWVCPYTATGQPCSPLQNIYFDSGLTHQITQPFSTDQYGNYNFFTAPGTYIVQLQISATVFYTYTETANTGGGFNPGTQFHILQYAVGGSTAVQSNLTTDSSGNNLTIPGVAVSGTDISQLPRVNVTYPAFGTGCPNPSDPSGNNDSTCAIIATINWSENNRQGGRFPPVYFPPGTYKITSSITDNGSIPYFADGATLNIAPGQTVNIGNQILSGNPVLPESINQPIVLPQDENIGNPLRSNIFPSDATVGKFRTFRMTGTIPNTSPYNFGQLNHTYIFDFFLDTVPGCWGFSTVCFNTEHKFDDRLLYVNGGGGTNVTTTVANFFSVGDHILTENYLTSFGGSVDGGGPEGTKGFSYFVGEAGDTWTGNVAAGHGGAGQTTINATCASDCGGAGYGITGNVPASVGQGLWINDEQNTVASGQIVSSTGGSGPTPGTMTVNITSGVSNLVPSTCVATLTANVSPQTSPSGSGSQALTFTVNNITGTCVAGQLVSFAGTNHEQAIITSATSPSGGRQTLTANLRLFHEASSYLFENAPSDAGLFADVVANHTGTLQFPFEILGIQSVSGNTVVMWWRFWYAGEAPGNFSLPNGRMIVGQQGAGTVTNTSGTVSMQVFGGSREQYFQSTTLYLSGGSDSAFTGACTNSFYTNINANPATLNCTQASSIGHSEGGTFVSLTDATLDNPYGNTRVNFYQGAAITDPQDYSTPLVVNGVNNYPVDGLQFQVEPNNMALNAGDPLVEQHSTLQLHDMHATLGAANPVNFSSSGWQIDFNGIYGNGGSFESNTPLIINNDTPSTAYSYFGGTMPPTPLIVTTGIWGDTFRMNKPPAPGSSIIRITDNCPSVTAGCNDPGYFWNLYNFYGNSAQFFPATNTMQWNGTQQFNSPGSASNDVSFRIFNNHNFNLGIIFGGYSPSFPTPVVPMWNNATPVQGDLAMAWNCQNGGTECGIADTGIPYTTLLINPMTTLGDLIYGGTSGTPTRLTGNTTSSQECLTETGTGSAATAPAFTACPSTANASQIQSVNVSASAPSSGQTLVFNSVTNRYEPSSIAGTVTSVGVGTWPSWLTPTVANATSTPQISVAASAIPNSALANSSITLGSTNVSLGATISTATGLSITGNAATATALAATPAQCTGGQFATGIAANGNANCASGSFSGNATSLQSFAISATAPTNGQALIYNSGLSSYVPTNLTGGGTITGVVAGTNMTGGGSSGSVTLNAPTQRGTDATVVGGLSTGATDNSSTFLSMLASFCASSACEIYIPCGIYNFTATPRVPVTSGNYHGVTILGEGRGTYNGANCVEFSVNKPGIYGLWWDNTSSGAGNNSGPDIENITFVDASVAADCNTSYGASSVANHPTGIGLQPGSAQGNCAAGGLRITQTNYGVLRNLGFYGFAGIQNWNGANNGGGTATLTVNNGSTAVSCSGCTFTSAMVLGHLFVNGEGQEIAAVSGSSLTLSSKWEYPTATGTTNWNVDYNGVDLMMEDASVSGCGSSNVCFAQYWDIYDLWGYAPRVGIDFAGDNTTACWQGESSINIYGGAFRGEHMIDGMLAFLGRCVDTVNINDTASNDFAFHVISENSHADKFAPRIENGGTASQVPTCAANPNVSCSRGIEYNCETSGECHENLVFGGYIQSVGNGIQWNNDGIITTDQVSGVRMASNSHNYIWNSGASCSTQGSATITQPDCMAAQASSFALNGAVWNTGTGAPSGSCQTGSIYSNTSGTSGSSLYACVASAWVNVK